VPNPPPGGSLDATMLAALVTTGVRFALTDGEKVSVVIEVK
jgi:hypothetical protein